MNILAHLYLSGTNDKIMVGNFIGDHVKGKAILKYDKEVQAGIYLHRYIDTYTDNHAIVRDCKIIFRDRYEKYAGIVTDIIFDHYLARNWHQFSMKSIDVYIQEVHEVLERYHNLFPARVKEFYPYFIKNNWLKIYGSLEGIERVLKGMSRRTSLPDYADFAVQRMEEKDKELNCAFIQFFESLKEAVSTEFLIGF